MYKGSVMGGTTSLAVKIGISVGWGDRYGYTVAFQQIDITGLTPGRYKLFGTVDAQNYHLESNETNNMTLDDPSGQRRQHREGDPAGPSRLTVKFAAPDPSGFAGNVEPR